MAEYAASLSCMKLHMLKSCIQERGVVPQNSQFRAAQRKYFYGSFKAGHLSSWKIHELGYPCVSNLKVRSCVRQNSLRSSCLGYLVNLNGAADSEWVPVVDQVLLMASIFLTYMAGVIPIRKSDFTAGKNIPIENVVPESSTSAGSAMKNDDQLNSQDAWGVVKEKLLDSLDAIERGGNLGKKVLESERQLAKRPLSLYAIADGPRLQLLWACFQRLQDEARSVDNILRNSEVVKRDSWLTVFSKIIRNSGKPICMAWLEKELCLGNNNADKALVSLMFEKLQEEDTVIQNIKKSGKEDLYAELLCFLRFGSLSMEGCCYDHSLFILHGVSLLEDLLITLADGIASVYLELISVDGNLSNELNSLGLVLCTLSTRALQRMRNEVALNWWLYQNVEAVVSMYEDRFDLYTLHSQVIDEPSRSQTEKYSWWKKLSLGTKTVSSPLCYAMISQCAMPVKRTKELRALTGWRYYYSLFLELSDISMPFIRAVFEKVSNAISFFLVCLIGRSVGLIYTGIRQSLGWK